MQNQTFLSEAFSLIFLLFATTLCWKDFCANSHNTFVKNMLKWRVGKQLHWSFMWLKGSESFCGKPFVLKESAQYSSSFLATTLSANSTKKILFFFFQLLFSKTTPPNQWFFLKSKPRTTFHFSLLFRGKMLVFTVFLEEKGQIVNKIKAAHTNVFENLKEKKGKLWKFWKEDEISLLSWENEGKITHSWLSSTFSCKERFKKSITQPWKKKNFSFLSKLKMVVFFWLFSQKKT